MLGHRQILALASVIVGALVAGLSVVLQKLSENPQPTNWALVLLPGILAGLSSALVGINALFAPVPEGPASVGVITPPKS